MFLEEAVEPTGRKTRLPFQVTDPDAPVGLPQAAEEIVEASSQTPITCSRPSLPSWNPRLWRTSKALRKDRTSLGLPLGATTLEELTGTPSPESNTQIEST